MTQLQLREDLAASMAKALDETEDLYDGTWPPAYVNEYLDAAGALIREYIIHYAERGNA